MRPRQQDTHRAKRAQLLTCNENVLIVAPLELRDATVRLDGHIAAYLWSASGRRTSGVDQYYKPAFPDNTDPDASATRIHVDSGSHLVTIEADRYLPIVKRIDESTQLPLCIVITRDELRHPPP